MGRFDGGPSRPPSRISNSKFSRGKTTDLTPAYTVEMRTQSRESRY